MRGLRVAETTLDLEITGGWTAAGGERRARIRHSGGPPVTIDYLPDVPLGAAFMDISVAGAEWIGAPQEPGAPGAAMPPPRVRLSEGETAVVTARWEGGLAVAPPRIDLEPGQRSTGLRVIDFEHDGEAWLLTIEGTAGREYALDLYGTPVRADPMDEGASVAPAPAAPDREPGDARPADAALRRFIVVLGPGPGTPHGHASPDPGGAVTPVRVSAILHG